MYVNFLFHVKQKTGEVSSLLKRARQEEKLQRKTFFENFGQHFILTLFPELQDRVPDITVSCLSNIIELIHGCRVCKVYPPGILPQQVHLPKSLSKSLMSADKDLESIRHLLPESLRYSLMGMLVSLTQYNIASYVFLSNWSEKSVHLL